MPVYSDRPSSCHLRSSVCLSVVVIRSQNLWKKKRLMQFCSRQRPACLGTALTKSGSGGSSVFSSAEADCRPSVSNAFKLCRVRWASGFTQIGENFTECQPGSMGAHHPPNSESRACAKQIGGSFAKVRCCRPQSLCSVSVHRDHRKQGHRKRRRLDSLIKIME